MLQSSPSIMMSARCLQQHILGGDCRLFPVKPCHKRLDKLRCSRGTYRVACSTCRRPIQAHVLHTSQGMSPTVTNITLFVSIRSVRREGQSLKVWHDVLSPPCAQGHGTAVDWWAHGKFL